MTVFKRERSDNCHDDTPVREQSRQYREMVEQALKDEAEGKNKPSFKPEEWGL